ncbi:hypothetical protein DM02DRAFT_258217 [Periconia macrospinosa]|uniref:Uncharacterized protein n=1 Tax=Periconia macrospinosa TaxID=97972 RepID=A0A2V1DYG0_9PLEO|nr:hypothetical protein DM02DRAFT_258217 [Periconia macrospinosa]
MRLIRILSFFFFYTCVRLYLARLVESVGRRGWKEEEELLGMWWLSSPHFPKEGSPPKKRVSQRISFLSFLNVP